MSTQIIIQRSPDEVAGAVAEWLIDSIREVLEAHSTCSIALSGGTTPKRLYEHIAACKLHSVDWSRVMLFWGDERNVPADDAESNFRMVKEAWLDRATSSGESKCIPRYFPVPITPASPERSAKSYSEVLRRELNSDGAKEAVPKLDIALLGLGDDSHTASLFPETRALDEKEEIFVANYVPKLGVYRLTMTFTMLNAARRIAFLVCGASKQAAIEVVWRGPRQGALYPAQRVQPSQGDLLWFLDLAAVPESGSSEDF